MLAEPRVREEVYILVGEQFPTILPFVLPFASERT